MLDVGSTGYKQDLTLGVDTAHAQVGFSVVSTTKETFSAVAILRNDISKKMQQRSAYRRTRRSRLRYRKPRFNNRSASTRKGRLAPSVQWKVDAHEKLIHQLSALLPLTKIVLETGTFDMAKMQNPTISNPQYQKGVQYDFENDMNGRRLQQLTNLFPHHANEVVRYLEAIHVLICRKGHYGKYLSINFNFSQ